MANLELALPVSEAVGNFINSLAIIARSSNRAVRREIPEAVFLWQQQLNPETGLRNNILLARAIIDLEADDRNGYLNLSPQRLGLQTPLASFVTLPFTGPENKLAIGVVINVDTPVKHTNNLNFCLRKTDVLLFLNALVQAQAAIENKGRNNSLDQVMTRNEFDRFYSASQL